MVLGSCRLGLSSCKNVEAHFVTLTRRRSHYRGLVVGILILRKSGYSLLKNLQEALEMEFPSRSTAKKEVVMFADDV
jgi:hypothetical protein